MDGRDYMNADYHEIEIRAGDTVLPAYQRTNLSLANIAEIKANFLWEKFQRPVVFCLPNGCYEIVDGQHRIRAVRELWGDDVIIPVGVTGRRQYTSRAGYFIDKARVQKNLTPLDLFNAEVEADRPDAVEIKRVCDALGVRLSHRYSVSSKANVCGAIVQLRRTNDLGVGVLERTLRILARIWPTDPDRHVVNNLQGISFFLVTFPESDDDRTVHQMTLYSDANGGARALSRAVNAVKGYHSSSNTGVARIAALVVAKEYNRRLKDPRRLDIDSLAFDSRDD